VVESREKMIKVVEQNNQVVEEVLMKIKWTHSLTILSLLSLSLIYISFDPKGSRGQVAGKVSRIPASTTQDQNPDNQRGVRYILPLW
tara:strand:+ start:2646 stop:2906 length:261 start_codon:yes stop_codon:yes gene_type:complete